MLAAGASPNFLPGDDRRLGAPLHIAAKRRSTAPTALLLAYGADPNAQDDHLLTPLHVCCGQRQVNFQRAFLEQDIAGLLLTYGACPVTPDQLGLLPTDYAREIVLRQKVQRAVQVWWRRSVALSVGRASIAGERPGAERVQVPWALPEILEAVLQWL